MGAAVRSQFLPSEQELDKQVVSDFVGHGKKYSLYVSC